jgi:hypothetical protein
VRARASVSSVLWLVTRWLVRPTGLSAQNLQSTTGAEERSHLPASSPVVSVSPAANWRAILRAARPLMSSAGNVSSVKVLVAVPGLELEIDERGSDLGLAVWCMWCTQLEA